MRLFKYKFEIHVPNYENQLNYELKDMIQVNDDTLSKKKIKKKLEKKILKQIFPDDGESILSMKVKQIKIL